ncbi:MAG: NADH-quinone oxidoreductase subunit C [Candidatus Micrarchaeia archaeon]
MKIEREDLLDKLREARKEGFDYLVKITAVDYVDHLEVIYFLRNMSNKKEENIRVEIKNGDALPSIVEIYKAADFYERELSEMFGIEILGRKVNRLLLEKWDGIDAPLRKSFVWGSTYKSD